jgi:hypothetical protein
VAPARGSANIPGRRKIRPVISNVAQRLAALERYERAMSRRKRAFRKLVAEQRKSEGISYVGNSAT